MKSRVYGRLLIYLLVMLLVFLIACTAAAAHTPSPIQDPVFLQWAVPGTSQTTELQRENQRLRHQTRFWRSRALTYHRTLIHQGSVTEAINLTCIVYGWCSTLWRKARCESTLSASSYNRSSSASGLFQFLPSTWRSTPFGRFSIWSPYSNALAAGWMHAHGRANEWSCR